MLTFYLFIYFKVKQYAFPKSLTCAAAWGEGSNVFCKPDLEFEEVAVPLLLKDDFYIDEELLWYSE